MARIKHRLVEPSDSPSDETQAISIFLEAGWPPDDARWLGPLCLPLVPSESRLGPELDYSTQLSLGVVAAAWNPSDPRHSRDRALLAAFFRLCGYGGNGARLVAPPSPRPPVDRAGLAASFRSHGANFERALIEGGWPGSYNTDVGNLTIHVRGEPISEEEVPEIFRLMHVLVDDAHLDLSSVVNCEELVAIGKRRLPDPTSPLRLPEPINWNWPPTTDARSLTNWMFGLGPRALVLVIPEFLRSHNSPNFDRLAVGIQDAIERWVFKRTDHWTYFDHVGPALGSAGEPFLQELERRCFSPESASDSHLRRTWLWFAWCVFASNRELWKHLSKESRERILRAANEDLARLRLLFGKAQLKPTAQVSNSKDLQLNPGESRDSWEEFAWEERHFETCVNVLYRLGGVWRGMKPLLLAIRAFGCACVSLDLRYWPERNSRNRPSNPDGLFEPPEPWSVVPRSLVNMFHVFIRDEQVGDPELTDLRGELAKFCLERLRDRWSKAEREAAEREGRPRTNEDMIERSAEWRLCLIRAASALHINPEGKGHHILRKASQIDPEEDVREAARSAYEQIRRFKGLPDNLSPRRAVISALWWWRQAHLLGLGIRPDPDGAQRTRIKELTRTREVEHDQ